MTWNAKNIALSRFPAGILRKSSGFGVFAEIFSKNIVIPSKEIPFFGFGFFRFRSDHPENWRASLKTEFS
jgi:hypothetical protein